MKAIEWATRTKNYEPMQRNKDGLRWIKHRFPIKGGISIIDVMKAEAQKPNPLLRMVQK